MVNKILPFPFLLLQVQLVATQILLDPDTVCRDLNFCTSNNTAHQRVHTGFHDKQSARILSEAPLDKGIYSASDKVASFLNSSKERSGKLINFVQLSDIHLDPLYSEVKMLAFDLGYY